MFQVACFKFLIYIDRYKEVLKNGRYADMLITYMNMHMNIPKKTTERTSGCAGDEPASAA